jgi:hypothetical protein
MTRQLSLSSQILNIEEQVGLLAKKNEKLEKDLQTKIEQINKLKLKIEKEQFKNSVYSQLLNQMTTIKISDVYKEEADGIHVYTDNIPIFIHNQNNTETKQITVKKQTIGKNFRTINKAALIEEKPEEQEQKIKDVEDKKEEIPQLDVSYSETISFIDTQLEEITKSRVYKKTLSNIKTARTKLLGKLGLDEYIQLVKKHVTCLEKIYKGKKYDQKKIQTLVSSSLSSLDQRLVYYKSYYSSELDPDDIQRLKVCLEVNLNHPKRYVPFIQSDICTKICNYSLCVISIKECIEKVLVNPYEFPNLGFLPNSSQTEDDPFSFYALEKIDSDGKRCWKMECRLDEISRFIREHLLTYCINMFRKIYYDVFSDNVYREDYTSKEVICNQDCEQLLMNIIILSKQKGFCNILRETLSTESIIKPSKNDKFDFRRDDPMLKKTFSNQEDHIKDTLASIQRLFDSITDEQCENIIRRLE